jgi:CRP/FNR family cyclic AMP-dependent transcriptional regulator
VYVVISAEQFRGMAYWSSELKEDEFERARRGISIKSYAKGNYLCHVGDRLEQWTGVVSGLAVIGMVSAKGKAASLIGLPQGAWFGEGTVLKGAPRLYDVIILRDSEIAFMQRQTFLWLSENSVAFNRHLVRMLNERLAYFIALAEYHRLMDATGRLARSIAWLFNPVLSPRIGLQIDITQEEIGALTGVSRQIANKSLQELEAEGLLKVGHGNITVLNLQKLARYGE